MRCTTKMPASGMSTSGTSAASPSSTFLPVPPSRSRMPICVLEPVFTAAGTLALVVPGVMAPCLVPTARRMRVSVLWCLYQAYGARASASDTTLSKRSSGLRVRQRATMSERATGTSGRIFERGVSFPSMICTKISPAVSPRKGSVLLISS